MSALTSKSRHAHRPWRLSRWLECGGSRVVWSLYPAPCPECPDCGGAGVWWTGGGLYGDDPDIEECSRCMEPLAEIRIPARFDRLLPGHSPALVPWDPAAARDDDPPF